VDELKRETYIRNGYIYEKVVIKLTEDKMAETCYMSCGCDSSDKIIWIKWNLIFWFKRVEKERQKKTYGKTTKNNSL